VNMKSGHDPRSCKHEPRPSVPPAGPGSGPDLSRRQSASQGRPSAHQATRGRFPDPLSSIEGAAVEPELAHHRPDISQIVAAATTTIRMIVTTHPLACCDVAN